MTQMRRPRSEQDIVMEAPVRTAPETQTMPDLVEKSVAPAAIERALAVYQQLQPRDQSVIVQARKILTQHIYGMVDQGEQDEQRLTVGGLAHLKAVERDHDIKSAHGAEAASPAKLRRRAIGSRMNQPDDRARTPLDRRRPEIRTQQVVGRNAGDVPFAAQGTGVQVLSL